MNFSIGERFPLFLTFTQVDPKTNFMNVWGQTDMNCVCLIEKKLSEWEPAFNGGTCIVPLQEIVIDDVYCAKFSGDKKWYRGRILGPSSRDNYFEIHFIDFGNVESISINDLRKLDVSLFTIEAQAHRFILGNVIPTDINWSIDALDLCRQYVYEEDVEATIIGIAGKIPTIKVTKKNRTKSLNDVLVEKGLASIEIMLPIEQPKPLNVTSSLPFTKIRELESIEIDENTRSFTFNKMSVGDVCDVVVVDVERDQKFWVNVLEHRRIASYDKMISDLEFHGNKLSATENVDRVVVGMMCIAENARKEQFARGVVVQTRDKDAEVFFVDYGNQETLLASKIYPLPKMFALSNALGLKCSLSSLPSETKPRDVNNTLTRLSEGCIIECRVDGLVCNGCYSVNLFHENENIFDRFTSIEYKTVSLTASNELYNVVVSYVSDPKTFYVQLDNRSEFYDLFDNKLQNEYGSSLSKENSLQFGHLPIGTPCAFYCKESLKWYRCRVDITINISRIKVYFVDTGRSQIVSPEELYPITRELVDCMPSRAICCGLYQFTFNPAIAKKSTNDFVSMVHGKNLGMQVIEIINETNVNKYAVQLIDYTTNPKRLINMILYYDLKKKFEGVVIRPPILEEVEKVFITSFVTSSLFFGQMVKFPMETLTGMSDAIEQYYGGLTSNEKLLCDDDLPHVGEYCCAPFAEDKKYYRAKILSQKAHKITVLFVDFGNQEVVDSCDVKILHEKFAILPAFGIQCSIANTFTHSLCDFRDSIKNILLDNTIEVEILESSVGVYDVNITDSKDNMEILNKLKMCGIERRRKNEVKIVPVVAPSCKPETVMTRFKENKSLGDFEGGMVTITYVLSPRKFWFTVCHPEPNDISKMASKIEAIPPKKHSEVEVDVRIGQPCLSWYDECWYRAEIVEVCSSGQVKVNYVDYGNDCVVDVSSLKQIPSSMMAIPKQAIKCSMANIVETEFDDDLLKKFEEATFNEVFMAKPQNAKSDCFSIDLFDSKGTNLAKCFGLTVRSTTATSVKPDAFCDGHWQDDGDSVFDSVSVVVDKDSQKANNGIDAADDWVESGDVTNGYEPRLTTNTIQNNWENSNYRSNRDGGSWKQKDDSGFSSQNKETSRYRANDFEVARDSERGYSRFVPPRMQRVGSQDKAAPWDRHSNNANENSNNNFDRNSRNFDSRGGYNSDRSVSREERKPPRRFESHGGYNSDHSSSRDERKPRHFAESHNGHKSDHFVSREEMKLKDVEIFCGSETLRSVRVCYVVGPSEFFCQLLELDSQFTTMNEKLQSYYGGLGFIKALNSYNSKIGAACCAKYSADEQWYRAKVQKVDGSDATIHFVDYGNDETMPQMELKVLEAQFYNVPMLALKCYLDNVKAPNENWTDDETTAFEARVLDKVFTARIVSRDADGRYGVHLHSSSVAVESSLNYQLIRERFALPVDPNNRIYKRILSDAVKSPFVETKLSVGKKESVSVSWVTSLGRFYCQLFSRKEELSKFEADLMKAYSNGGSSAAGELHLSNLEVGAACVALYRETNYSAWCRAVILNVEAANVYVHYVDYGNVGYVPKSDLRMILPDFKAFPMQAIKCRFFGVKPLMEEWPMLEGDQLKEFFQGTTIEFVFRAHSDESNLVDLLIDGESVADKLVAAGLLEQQHEPTDVMTPGCEIHAEPEELTDGFHEMEICAVHSPQMFWCRLASCTDLVNEMSEELRTSDLSDLPSYPTIGLVVVCKKKEQNLLCRAIIVERLTPTEFKVLFVDFGDVATASVNELKLCSSKLARRSHMALLCTLTGITKETERTVSKVFALEVVPGRRLTAHVDGKILGVHTVTLFVVSDEVTNLNLLMGLESSVLYVDGASREIVNTDLVEEHDQKLGDSEAKLEAPSTEQFETAEEEKVEVVLTSITSPKSFWVQKTSEESELLALSESLNAAYADSYAEDLDSMEWTPDSLCVGLYSSDHMWYRARIVSVSHDTLTVVFIDYGNEETLPLVNVRRISEEFTSVLPFATHCTLDVPLERDISDFTLNAFQEEVGYGEEVLKVEFLRQEANQYVVKLYDCSGNDLLSLLNLDQNNKDDESDTVDDFAEGETGLLVGPNEDDSTVVEFNEVEPVFDTFQDSSEMVPDSLPAIGFTEEVETSEKYADVSSGSEGGVPVDEVKSLPEEMHEMEIVGVTETEAGDESVNDETKEEVAVLAKSIFAEMIEVATKYGGETKSSGVIEREEISPIGGEEVFENVSSENDSTEVEEESNEKLVTQAKDWYEEDIDETSRLTMDITEPDEVNDSDEREDKTCAIQRDEVPEVFSDISTNLDGEIELGAKEEEKEEAVMDEATIVVYPDEEQRKVENYVVTETEIDNVGLTDETKEKSDLLEETKFGTGCDGDEEFDSMVETKEVDVNVMNDEELAVLSPSETSKEEVALDKSSSDN